MSFAVVLSLIVILYEADGSSVCMDDCTTSTCYNGYTPSLYHRYCCLPTKEFCSSIGVYSHTSCHEVLNAYPNAESGYYYITKSNGDIVSVYCDMEGRNCDGKGGWTRVAFLNMTQPGATCPSGELRLSPPVESLCWNTNSLIADYYSDTGCASAFFPSIGSNYTEVCGQVRGYQSGRLHAFNTPNYTNNIDSSYVEGISITHGANPRKHIWTYAVGKESDANDENSCPCNANYTGGSNPKLFVGSHYYCESGVPAGEKANSSILYYSDALWDGKDCDGIEGPCCTNPKLPWFYRKLDEETTDDIELRSCNSKKFVYDNSPIDIVEIFIR